MPTDPLGLPGFDEVSVAGQGGFGIVYRAHQIDFDRTVAIKVLTGQFDDQARSRFDRERRALGALSSHPNIVAVYASGLTDDGRPYIVMEFAPGGSLADRLVRDGPLPWSEAAIVGAKLADALAAAHQAGVLHRDVKPENVLFSPYGEPMLADFGIATVAGHTVTRSGIVTASLGHAAPEILDGRRPSEASDLYSLASTVFAAMSGNAPFMRDDDEPMITVIARTATEAPPDLRLRGVPDAVCSVLERGLAKDPDDRYRSAAEFGDDLRQAAAGVMPSRAAVTGRPTPARATRQVADAATTEERRRRRPALLGAVAAGVIVLVGGVAFALSQGGGSGSKTSPSLAPAMPSNLTGFRRSGASTTATVRVFAGQPAYVDNFPWTMTRCNQTTNTTTWRSLVRDDVVAAGSTDVHGSKTLQASEVMGIHRGEAGLIRGDGCKEPVFFLAQSPRADTLVDVAVTTQSWTAAP